jgi:hypothetical protein
VAATATAIIPTASILFARARIMEKILTSRSDFRFWILDFGFRISDWLRASSVNPKSKIQNLKSSGGAGRSGLHWGS